MEEKSGDWIILPEFENFEKEEKLPDNHVSFLLGAGFSVNQGYPMASELNEQIQSVNPDNLTIDSEGNLFNLPESKEDPFWYFSDARKKHFVKELIGLFMAENKEFDYEMFYDFLMNPELLKRTDFKEVCEQFRKKYDIKSDNLEYGNRELIDKTVRLINQYIQILLVDKNDENFYKPVGLMKPLPEEYTGFLQLTEKMGEDSIVHIHSLNHDIYFETFNQTEWINGDLADGFEEMGSKFYGRIEDNKMIRLKYFANKYDKKYNLYKLHGSLDQFPFRHQDGSPTEYIKIRKGVSTSNLYKEVEDEDGNFFYENDFTNYHPDFLSGTTHKILRYDEEGYFKEVFEHFVNNLKKSNKLIIVGYGCRDSEINKMIVKNFDFKNKPVFILDPFPSDEVKSFAAEINAEIIEQTPDKPLLGKVG